MSTMAEEYDVLLLLWLKLIRLRSLFSICTCRALQSAVGHANAIITIMLKAYLCWAFCETVYNGWRCLYPVLHWSL